MWCVVGRGSNGRAHGIASTAHTRAAIREAQASELVVRDESDPTGHVSVDRVRRASSATGGTMSGGSDVSRPGPGGA